MGSPKPGRLRDSRSEPGLSARLRWLKNLSRSPSDAGLVSKSAIGKKSRSAAFPDLNIAVARTVSPGTTLCHADQDKDLPFRERALSPSARQGKTGRLFGKTHTVKNAEERVPV